MLPISYILQRDTLFTMLDKVVATKPRKIPRKQVAVKASSDEESENEAAEPPRDMS